MADKVNIKVDIGGIVKSTISSILFACLGYFVYGGIKGFIAVFMIAFIIPYFISVCSLIPIFGWIGSVLITYYWLLPALFNLTGIYWTGLITVIFGVSVLWGFIITIIVALTIIYIIFD